MSDNRGSGAGRFGRERLHPGSKIGSYVIEEQVGAGGMAVVYRARDEDLGRLVAVKVLNPELAADAEFRARFLRESRAVAAVDEPHIVPVYQAGQADGLLYIVTKFVASGDLARLQDLAGGALPPALTAGLVTQVAAALDAAHAVGLVHRDVKPGNILVERVAGRPDYAYLADFGLSKNTATNATGVTAPGGNQFLGTPDFCAPEQITGDDIDGRADQYSLACVAFSLLAGRPPYSWGAPMARLYAHVNEPVPAVTAIRPELPGAVDEVLAWGMAKARVDRYESCAAFASALSGALGAAGYLGAHRADPAGVGAQGVSAAGTGQAEPGAALSRELTPPSAQRSPVTPAGQGHPDTLPVAWQHPSMPPTEQHPSMPPPGTTDTQARRWPRRRVIVAWSAAAAVVVAGVLTGVGLAGHGSGSGPPPTSADEAVAADKVATFSVPGDLSRGAFFSADSDYIAAADGKSGVYVFRTTTMKLVKIVSVPGGDAAYAVSFSADDKTLSVVDETAWAIDDLDVSTGNLLHSYPLPYWVRTAGFWNNGSSVVGVTNANGSFSEYEVTSGKVYATLPNPGSGKVTGAVTDATGRHVLLDSANGTAYLLDAQTGAVLGKFSYEQGEGKVYPQLSLDGSTVYLPGNHTAPARLWNVPDKRYVTPQDSRWPAVDAGVALGTDSRFDVTSPASPAEAADIWNIETRSHVVSVTLPGTANQNILSLGIGGTELLSAASSDGAHGKYSTLYLWALPN